MGVTITKLGTYTEKDLITMKEWQEERPKLDAISDLASWLRLSKFVRVALPTPFNNCIKADTKDYAKQLEMTNLKTSVSTRFWSISIHEVAPFRRSVWLDDSCFMLAMNYMIDPELGEITDRGIGGVNPLFARMADDNIKRDLIESTSPFRRGNKIVLIPIYLDSHWGGAVFDFEDNKLVLFDPMQTRAHYEAMDKVINEFFGEHVSGLDRIQQRAPRQEDTNSCGPLTLLFFECMARGIPVPSVSPEAIPYVRFRFLFLSTQHLFSKR